MPHKKWPIGTALSNSVDELSVDDEDDDDNKDEDDDDDDDAALLLLLLLLASCGTRKRTVSRMIFTLGR